jgi:LmbE family N-acetylglucosaminyl deacetylase
MENVLVFCAHPDDEVFGLGGTIAKYSQEGKKVIIIVCSYGENSLPWLKEKEVAETRKKECLAASEIIGVSKTIFLGLKEGLIDNADIETVEKIKNAIKEYAPEKVFLHSIDDPHIDHKAVYRLVLKLLIVVGYKGEVYAFDVWNPINFTKRASPKLYVDITKTFGRKIRAIKMFKSQKIQGRWPLLPAAILKAIVYGFQSRHFYAERFVKVNLN